MEYQNTYNEIPDSFFFILRSSINDGTLLGEGRKLYEIISLYLTIFIITMRDSFLNHLWTTRPS